MRPKQLKSQFSWKERRVMMHDRVFFVPDYLDNYEDFSFPGWNDPSIFKKQQPISVEYCSGNGAWIAQKAIENPHINWVAVEIRFDRVRKIWSKLKNHQLDNLFIVCGEAHTVTQYYFPKDSVQDVYINFPDPWPKNKHAKNRLMTEEFVRLIASTLKEEGLLTFVTDDSDYSSQAIEVIQPTLQSLYESPFYITNFSDYGSSYFEELWRGKGKQILYHQFQKIADSQ